VLTSAAMDFSERLCVPPPLPTCSTSWRRLSPVGSHPCKTRHFPPGLLLQLRGKQAVLQGTHGLSGRSPRASVCLQSWGGYATQPSEILLGLGFSLWRSAGGNKRKLSVGIALMGSPQLVFLDEPR
jgi:hypothetical protein